MAAMINGLALHGGLIPYGGTFLVFTDYARNAIRMSALMRQRVIYVLTHDSIGLGEDGPTHQPIEHAATLRMIPNLQVWRPADAIETAIAWAESLSNAQAPSCLLLSRQNLRPLQQPTQTVERVRRGGYVLADAAQSARVVLIATGSEVHLALQAQASLAAAGIAARVVSMPCTSAFDAQPADYRRDVLPPGVPRLAIEAGQPDYWRKYVGLEGGVVGIGAFGESAPAPELYRHFGLTAEHIAEAARALVI